MFSPGIEIRSNDVYTYIGSWKKPIMPKTLLLITTATHKGGKGSMKNIVQPLDHDCDIRPIFHTTSLVK